MLKITKQTALFLFLTVAGVSLFSPKAHAYLDPGSGSLIIQLIVAALIGASMTLKIFWSNITAFFTKRKKPGQSETPKN